MENEPRQRLTGIDRKLEILNGISTWVKGIRESELLSYFVEEIPIPENILDEDAIKDLHEIGTSEYEFDAACSGITIGDPRDRDKQESDIIS